MGYEVRTEDGILIGEVDNVVAGMMIEQLTGEWQEKTFREVGKKLVYVFTAAAAFGNTAMKIQVWKGYYLTRARNYRGAI